ncbi:hsp20-like protein [Trichoderma gamsii]|uniref:Hsp20-like protein n=1 Tax=Trichoderma gamsii TaxID=398673 RepID=A0A2P4ZMU5_9HYPO|nr:hsp20-like protein [Trichoderma gamsii]PON25612.1 hsp20-like protein [Trichoderma gamsii]
MAAINQPTTPIRTFPSTLRFFQDIDKHLDSFPRFSHSSHGNRGPHLGQAFLPIFDVRELHNSFELYGELPGVEKENIKIEFKGSKSLEVSGFVENSYQLPPNQGDDVDTPDDATRKDMKTTEHDSVKYWVAERNVGEFYRSFTFPQRVQQNGTTATLESGVLTIRIPKMPDDDSDRHVIPVS